VNNCRVSIFCFDLSHFILGFASVRKSLHSRVKTLCLVLCCNILILNETKQYNLCKFLHRNGHRFFLQVKRTVV
jgi:hypothetical protein